MESAACVFRGLFLLCYFQERCCLDKDANPPGLQPTLVLLYELDLGLHQLLYTLFSVFRPFTSYLHFPPHNSSSHKSNIAHECNCETEKQHCQFLCTRQLYMVMHASQIQLYQFPNITEFNGSVLLNIALSGKKTDII